MEKQKKEETRMKKKTKFIKDHDKMKKKEEKKLNGNVYKPS